MRVWSVFYGSATPPSKEGVLKIFGTFVQYEKQLLNFAR